MEKKKIKNKVIQSEEFIVKESRSYYVSVCISLTIYQWSNNTR